MNEEAIEANDEVSDQNNAEEPTLVDAKSVEPTTTTSTVGKCKRCVETGRECQCGNKHSDKAQEYLEGWQRAKADYDNLQKQLGLMRTEDRRQVRRQLAEDLLAVIDNFGYVMKHFPAVEQCSPEFQQVFKGWSTGITHIDRQFSEVLKNLGVVAITAIGEKFNSGVHEAVGSRVEAGNEVGIVIEEMVKGWKLIYGDGSEVVIRPAKVIVSEMADDEAPLVN